MFQGFTLKVSIALATVGEEIGESSARIFGSSGGHGGPPVGRGRSRVQMDCWRRCLRTSRICSRTASTWARFGFTARAFSKYSGGSGRSSFWR